MDTSSPLYIPRSDVEEDQQWQQQQRNVAQQLLNNLGHLLDQAESGLNELETNDLLRSAILRRCEEMADAVGNLANQLTQQSVNERRELALACMESDAQLQQLRLGVVGTDNNDAESTLPTSPSRSAPISQTAEYNRGKDSPATKLGQMTEDDMMNAIAAAASLLRDVESGLRSIDPNDADEIADAALIGARLFLISLKSFHDTLDPASLCQQSSSRSSTDDRIQFLQDDDEGRSVSSATNESHSSSFNQKRNQRKRFRALWPPIGPAVGNAMNWGKEEALKRPLFAVALGITLWPAAVVAAFVGAPILFTDGLIQHVYQNCQEKPLVQGLEIGVAQLYHTARLSLLCGKLVGKQAFRVISHQVEERGGAGPILQQAGHFALDRVTHPVETLSITWNGVVWGASVLCDSWQFVTNVTSDERGLVVQALQQ